MRARCWAVLAAAMVLNAGSAALADPCQINISGATLFRDFFTRPASTNDFINADNDFYQQCNDFYYDAIFGWVCTPKTCVTAPWARFDACVAPFVDQLALTYAGDCSASASPWLVNYRGVGSGNGLAEMRDFALEGQLPHNRPAEGGWINRTQYASTTGCVGTGCGTCATDPNTCSPVCQVSIDLGVMDVPTTWFVTTPGAPAWSRRPTEPGYGLNPLRSYCGANENNQLKSLCNAAGTLCLNLELATPDSLTVYDTPIAWVPVAFIANPGTVHGATPKATFRESELQHLFLTGRLPSGENLIAATRDAGSGTRNAAMNSLCLDPSWGRGDNVGKKTENGKFALIGPHYRPTNAGGSGVIEDAVRNARLAVGYTGLAGASRAAQDAIAGQYEIVGVAFDRRLGEPNAPGVRPTISAVLDNADPHTGYPIGGNETFASVGDPYAGLPGHETNPRMLNTCAADYLRNLVDSIVAFEANPGLDDPNNQSMPGQLLAREYFLVPGLDALPDPVNPCSFLPNPDFNAALQEYMRTNNGLGIGSDCPAFGSASALFKVPVRAKDSDYAGTDFPTPGVVWPAAEPCDCAYPPNGQYSDGSLASGTNASNYRNYWTGAYSIAGGSNLPPRNLVAGDFNNDGRRDINDIPQMMAALRNPTAWVTTSGFGGSAANPAVPELLGDFNADGNFDCRDIRYFCDGLALDATGKLNRAAAFLAVDTAWLALTGNDDNFFNTTIQDCAGAPLAWAPGAAVFDAAGGCPAPGAAPTGYDCVVNCVDARYIDGNFGSWANVDDAVRIDLSCDVTGDNVVDCADALAIRQAMGGCACPDLLHSCTSPVGCPGNANCDAVVSWRDIDYFIAGLNNNVAAWTALFPPPGPACPFSNLDCNSDGNVTWRDIDPFIALLNTNCP